MEFRLERQHFAPRDKRTKKDLFWGFTKLSPPFTQKPVMLYTSGKNLGYPWRLVSLPSIARTFLGQLQ
eukprot:1913352-Amphidinium_carterae.1